MNKERLNFTSPVNEEYNCVAWAIGVNDVWWWPDSLKQAYWPETVPREESVPAFVEAFGTVGFSLANGETYDPRKERIAILSKDGARPSHVARELADGRWASKLGRSEDVEHALPDMEGAYYGHVCAIMARPRD